MYYSLSKVIFLTWKHWQCHLENPLALLNSVCFPRLIWWNIMLNQGLYMESYLPFALNKTSHHFSNKGFIFLPWVIHWEKCLQIGLMHKKRGQIKVILKKKAAKAQIVPDIFPFLNSSPFPLHPQPSAQTEEKKKSFKWYHNTMILNWTAPYGSSSCVGSRTWSTLHFFMAQCCSLLHIALGLQSLLVHQANICWAHGNRFS